MSTRRTATMGILELIRVRVVVEVAVIALPERLAMSPGRPLGVAPGAAST